MGCFPGLRPSVMGPLFFQQVFIEFIAVIDMLHSLGNLENRKGGMEVIAGIIIYDSPLDDLISFRMESGPECLIEGFLLWLPSCLKGTSNPYKLLVVLLEGLKVGDLHRTSKAL